jgi:hypothetical protein
MKCGMVAGTKKYFPLTFIKLQAKILGCICPYEMADYYSIAIVRI